MQDNDVIEELINEKRTELIQAWRMGKKAKEILIKKARKKGHTLIGYINYLCVCDAQKKD